MFVRKIINLVGVSFMFEWVMYMKLRHRIHLDNKDVLLNLLKENIARRI